MMKKGDKETIVVNQKLKQLVREGVKDIYFEDIKGSDQYFHIVTNLQDVIFGVNDLGVWIKKQSVLLNPKKEMEYGYF